MWDASAENLFLYINGESAIDYATVNEGHPGEALSQVSPVTVSSIDADAHQALLGAASFEVAVDEVRFWNVARSLS